MATKSKTVNWGGMDIVCRSIRAGVTKKASGEVDLSSLAAGSIQGLTAAEVVTTGATRTLTQAESGMTFVLAKADGVVFTLPTAPTVGTNYRFVVRTSVTSNAYKWATGVQGTDWFIGGLLSVDTDSSNAVAYHSGNGSTHDNLSMNGTDTGGLLGTDVVLTYLAGNRWHVAGTNFGSGSVATPFATT